MPEPTHPPYELGSITTPRQLQRWLDINAQNGALTRTRFFLQIPGFQITPINWRGFSEIVAEWHLTSSNAFSLQLTNPFNTALPTNPSFTMTIAWVDSNGNTSRYRLCSSPNEVIYFNIPQYTGQHIAANFKIEVWSTNTAIILNPTATTLYTSVLGSLDYRYGSDQQLVAFGNACVNQQVTINNLLVPPGWNLPIQFNVCGITGGGVTIIGTETVGVLGTE